MLDKDRALRNLKFSNIQEDKFKKVVLKTFDEFFKRLKVPPSDPDAPMTVDLASDLLNRKSLNDILAYRDISEDGICLIEDGRDIRLGFLLEFYPLMIAGMDAEEGIATVLGELDQPGAVAQFGVLSHQWLEPFLDGWGRGRTKSGNPIFSKMASYRRDMFLLGAHVEPLAKNVSDMRPKDHVYFLAITVPFDGDIANNLEWEQFQDKIQRLRLSIKGAMNAIGLRSEIMNGNAIKILLRLLLNPHIYPNALVSSKFKPYSGEGVSDLVSKEHRMIVTDTGALDFSSNKKREEVRHLVPMTVDFFPKENYIYVTNRLMGNFLSPTERINAPFYLYLNIQIVDNDESKSQLIKKKAMISRQLVSDSPVMQSLLGGLFQQHGEITDALHAISNGNRLIGLYMGINVWDKPEKIDETVGAVKLLWASHGFSVSPEPYISLPVWIASLPMHYYPHYDPIGKSVGLQRARTMTSAHVGYFAPVQGSWKGTIPNRAGLLLLSRQNQVATFDIQDKTVVDNYNFCVIASSGAGKSFFSQEIVMDFLSKKGQVFIIDAGRSYYDLCELLGGTNLVFKVNEPLDLNPFQYLETKDGGADDDVINDNMEMLKDVTLYMMYPTTLDNLSDWIKQHLEKGIREVFKEKGQHMKYADLQQWFYEYAEKERGKQSEDKINLSREMGDQLSIYTEGRFKRWFDGSGKQARLDKSLIVVEMDDLKSQGSFRDVVLAMITARISSIIYQTKDRSQPKLMLIDEAWDLLSSPKMSGFIERAYRTYRKYGGSAGIITQSFMDIKISKAAQAAFANSSWIFALKQNKDAYNQALNEGVINHTPVEKKLVESVHTLQGHYSEVYVKATTGISGAGIYRFFVDRYTYRLFSTNPVETQERTKLVDEIQEKEKVDYFEALSKACDILAKNDYKKMLGDTPSNILRKELKDNYTPLFEEG